LIKHEYQIAMASNFSEQVFQVGEVDILELTRPHFQRNSAAIAQPAGTFANRDASSPWRPWTTRYQPRCITAVHPPLVLRLTNRPHPTGLKCPAHRTRTPPPRTTTLRCRCHRYRSHPMAASAPSLLTPSSSSSRTAISPCLRPVAFASLLPSPPRFLWEAAREPVRCQRRSDDEAAYGVQGLYGGRRRPRRP
jgi:hypothetical protein